MLVLTRGESEQIRIGDSIILTVVRVSGKKVRLGIEAPGQIEIVRRELDAELGPEDPADVIYPDESECQE